MFRKLRADEIEVRVGSVMEGAATLLLYKDARCDMNILDETVGAMYWKRSHSRDNANCTVSIFNHETGEWVSKEDTGTESFTEREKGLASDSFKRACVNWGIGRELYTAPRIKIKCETVESGGGHKLKNKWEFWGAEVAMIDYDLSDKICSLEIVKGNNIIYSMDEQPNNFPAVQKEMKDMDERISESQAQSIMVMIDAKGRDRAKFLKHYGVTDFTHLTKAQYGDALNLLKKAKDKSE